MRGAAFARDVATVSADGDDGRVSVARIVALLLSLAQPRARRAHRLKARLVRPSMVRDGSGRGPGAGVRRTTDVPYEQQQPVRSARRRRHVDGSLARDDGDAGQAARSADGACQLVRRRRHARRRRRGERRGAGRRARDRTRAGRPPLHQRRVDGEPVLRCAQARVSAGDQGGARLDRPRRRHRRRDAPPRASSSRSSSATR